MDLYISTVADPMSGESVEMRQLAEASGARLVHDVPPEGTLLYFVNVHIRSGAEDLEKLRLRRGLTGYIVGVLDPPERADHWRAHFGRLAEVSDLFFVKHPVQVACLATYGIHARYSPIIERRFEGPPVARPGTVVFTGFYWPEKDIPMILQVARLLPEWRFTIHIPSLVRIDGLQVPSNVALHSQFVPAADYLAFLAKFEYVWIPRSESRWLYAGRSGLSALASGRPALLTDVGPNGVIPTDAAVKYPADWPAERIAELLRSRPQVDAASVRRFVDAAQPERVWADMRVELERRGMRG